MGLTYKDAGVDVEGGNQFVKKIGPIVKSTFSERVITDIGGFGALFSASFPEMKEPILVAGTDGVGTKLKYARLLNKHDTIGIDAVAMCVNDIVVSGAKPLFFLDYLACGKLNIDMHVDVVKGLAEGCRLADCSLIGGETAEHPGIMPDDDYDIGGFAVGVVDKSKIINGSDIAPGDIIIGIPSSGLHSNGFSLVRKIYTDSRINDLKAHNEELGASPGEIILTPTRIYTRSIIHCINAGNIIKGLVHVTGGGFYENIPRILPDGTAVNVSKKSFSIPKIFDIIQREGDVSEKEMFTTYNMGIGMMLFAGKNSADSIVQSLIEAGENPVVIGEVIGQKGNERVNIS
jgi:phosphoribosylformylglycinamidine cyclo-ligase